MNKMIQIENISKVFRTTEVETVALNHVNLEVKESKGYCNIVFLTYI